MRFTCLALSLSRSFLFFSSVCFQWFFFSPFQTDIKSDTIERHEEKKGRFGFENSSENV